MIGGVTITSIPNWRLVMVEKWSWIRGFEGEYLVSDRGRVKSCERVCVRKNISQPIRERILKHGVNKKTGYHSVALRKGGKSFSHYVHRLVALAFVVNPNGLPEVNHEDRNKGNNRADNLKWVSSQQNKKHAVENGVIFNPHPSRGSNVGRSKLTEDQVVEIRTLLSRGKSQYWVADQFQVTQANVSAIHQRKTWAHV